jgi:hypothetical protein
MTTVSQEDARAASARGGGPVRWALGAVGLLLASAALQGMASFERWVPARNGWDRADISIEDHRLDYAFPADPWENVGTAAQLFGLGSILLALGVLAMAKTVSSAGSPARRWNEGGLEGMLVVVAAGSFALTGLHALLSGIVGAPTLLQHLPLQLLFGAVGFAGLIILAGRWLRASWPTALACLLLLGSSLPGYLVATFTIAPAVAGYQSHDTTPWTETIVAVWPALAAVAMCGAAGWAARRGSWGRAGT